MAAKAARARRSDRIRYIPLHITIIRHEFAPMDIESKSLTACEVTPDGSAILLGFVDTDGKPATIRLSLNQVGALPWQPTHGEGARKPGLCRPRQGNRLGKR